jgi:hypothetical protein
MNYKPYNYGYEIYADREVPLFNGADLNLDIKGIKHQGRKYI